MHFKRVLKPRGAVVLFGSQPFTSVAVMSNIKWFKYCWTWDKVTAKGHLVAKIRPMQQTEDILAFGSGRINYYPIMTPRDRSKVATECKRTEIMGGSRNGQYSSIRNDYYPKTILKFSGVHPGNRLHPTQKPIALLEYLIRTYTNENDTVLDPTMGSGTTGHACANLDRQFIGIEKDAGYFRKAQARIEKAKRTARQMELSL